MMVMKMSEVLAKPVSILGEPLRSVPLLPNNELHQAQVNNWQKLHLCPPQELIDMQGMYSIQMLFENGILYLLLNYLIVFMCGIILYQQRER